MTIRYRLVLLLRERGFSFAEIGGRLRPPVSPGRAREIYLEARRKCGE